MRRTIGRRLAAGLVAVGYICGVLVAMGGSALAAAPNGSTLNGHQVMVDDSGKIVSWLPVQDQAYAQVTAQAWNYLLNLPANACGGKPAYFCYSYQNPDTQTPVGWPHNPAGLYAMLIESALEYYQFSGDSRVLQLAQNVANQELSSGMTLASDNWANVPYASGDAGSLTYHGAAYGNSGGSGDGTGVIEPDKVGELGHGFVELYKLTGNQTYLTAAINAADALANHVRAGNATQSPWPFRVVAQNGTIKEQYTAHVISPIELFDDLTSLNAGNVASYQSARTTAWNWMMAYPMQNNNWSAYFEDVGFQTDPSANDNQLDAMMTARYLLQYPETDPSWEAHVRGLISWVEQTFGAAQFGATTIKEQQIFPYAMGSHTSRYAEVNALLYEKTGDATAREKAYRAFNWATYMARSSDGVTSNGIDIDGPQVNNQWFTDGYGDFIRHFMIGMGAVPDFAPNGQTHLLESSSIVQHVDYSNPNQLSYQTFDNTGTEEIKVTAQPTAVTLNGTALTQRSDLNAEGWTFDPATSTVHIRRDTGNSIVVTLSGSPTNQAPTVSLTSPTNSSNFTAPASFSLNATASDADGSVSKVEFYQNGALISTATTAPYSYSVQNLPAGNYTFTARVYDDQNASTVSNAASVTVTAPSSLPSGWTNADIGGASNGSATYANGVFTVKGAGNDIYDNSDMFNFTYTSMNGDGSVTARVASQQNTDQWALAGVMIRDTLDANARETLASLTPSHGYSFDYRSSTGGATTYVNGNSGTAPGWVRLTRSGSTITAYKSTNGTSWTQMGSVSIAMGSTVYVGLAVAAHDNNTALATDTFNNVTATGAGDTTAPTITGIAAGNISVNGANITWTTNEPSTSQVDYGTTTAYGSSTAVNTSLDTNHSQIVAGLQDGTTYHYRVRSTDAAGNAAVSGDNTFTTPAVPDSTPPSAPTNVVAIATSTTQANVSWTAATDNVSVTGYTIYRDGTQVGTSTSASFSDSGLTPGQSYSYTVTARDAAGNVSAASNTGSITMPQPDTTAPGVAMTAPNDGATVSSTVSLSATASDNVGVSKVEFYTDNTLVGSVTNTPYNLNWNSASLANGQHTLTAKAYDAAGNSTVSAPITVTVNNVTTALAVDKQVSTHQSSAATTITSPSFTTTQGNELLVAFIASDGPSGTQSIKSVTGGGLTWTLRQRANTRAGTSEIWTAVAPSVLTNATVTATRNSGSYIGDITVVSFTGADTTNLGAVASANGTTGAPTVSLTTTRAGSWVWGVGNDWDHATARTVGANQTKVDEYVASSMGDTFWVQRQTAATPNSGTSVTLNDTTPINDRWNFAAIEILPTP